MSQVYKLNFFEVQNILAFCEGDAEKIHYNEDLIHAWTYF